MINFGSSMAEPARRRNTSPGLMVTIRMFSLSAPFPPPGPARKAPEPPPGGHGDDPDVFAFRALAPARAGPVGIRDHGVIEKDTLGGSSRGGEEGGDGLRLLDPVAGLLEHLARQGLFGRFAGVDDPGHHLGHPALIAALVHGWRA